MMIWYGEITLTWRRKIKSWHIKASKKNKFKAILSALFLLFCIGYLFYTIGKRVLTSYWLRHNPVQVKAVIIDEKDYWGNSPVSHQSSYAYLFYVNGEAYTNDSHDSKLQVGDSITIEYAKRRPYFNRPVARNR